MEIRELTSHDDSQIGDSLPSGSPTEGNLGSLREQGESFWAAGDDAINRALSGNSTQFNQAARQEGGQ